VRHDHWFAVLDVLGTAQTTAITTLFGCQVWKVSWWMMMYGSLTPKRSYCFSNAYGIQRLDVGWRRMKAKIATVEKYIDRKGRQRWKGTSQLKSTE